MDNMIYFEDIRTNINEGKYELKSINSITRQINELTHNYIIDEDKSVKWNREEANNCIAKLRAEKISVLEDNCKVRLKFRADLTQAAYDEYKFTKAQMDRYLDCYLQDFAITVECVNDVEDFIGMYCDLAELAKE